MYVEKMVLAFLQTTVTDIMSNKGLAGCKERREMVLKALKYFEQAYSASMEKMKEMAIETVLYFCCA